MHSPEAEVAKDAGVKYWEADTPATVALRVHLRDMDLLLDVYKVKLMYTEEQLEEAQALVAAYEEFLEVAHEGCQPGSYINTVPDNDSYRAPSQRGQESVPYSLVVEQKFDG